MAMIKKEDIGLYRDGGLGVFCHLSGLRVDGKRKQITELFKKFELSNTVEINIKTVDFQDVFFNLTIGTFKPYIKPNDSTVYIHENSIQPPSIIKELPKSIIQLVN